MLRDTQKVRDLLICLVRRDLIVRYQSSVLGFFWSFARPLALVVIFTLAFRLILKVSLPNPNVPFALHMLVGVLVWGFFSRSVSEGHFSVLAHANLIKKVKLPSAVFPAATVAGNLINFLLAMVVVYPVILIVMSRRGMVSSWEIVPLQLVLFAGVTVVLTVLTFALTMLVSAVNVYFRDMEPISDVVLQAWFYATPIVYPISLLYGEGGGVFDRLGATWAPVLKTLYWLNPLTPICVAYRRILLYRGVLEAPDRDLLIYLGVVVALSVLSLFVALAIFRRASRFFADEI